MASTNLDLVRSIYADKARGDFTSAETFPRHVKLGIAGSVASVLGLVGALAWLGVRQRLLGRRRQLHTRP